jgi:hypothetical protein
MKPSSSTSSMSDECLTADLLYFLTHNPENYFHCIESVLYRNEHLNEDLNKNMFVFPLRLGRLIENFVGRNEEDHDNIVEVYESHAVLQIFKYFLINQIK